MTLALLALALGCGDKADDTASSASGGFRVEPAVYMFGSTGADWVAPAGFADDVPEHPILVGVEANGADAVHLTLALGAGSVSNPRQDVGRRTLELGAPVDRKGHFVVGPADIDEEGADAQLVIHDLVVSGTLTDSALEDIVLKGSLDAADAGEQLCALAAKNGAECGPCLDGEVRCVPFEVHQSRALALPGFHLQELVMGSWCAGVLVPPLGATAFRLRRRKATA